MGKLIKNHWARLLILTAATYQIAAAIYAFFWPKLFFDFLTTNLDPIVKPIPILQILNLLLGLLALAWEWPLPLFTNASMRCNMSVARNKPGAGPNSTADTTRTGLEAAVEEEKEKKRSGGRRIVEGVNWLLAGMHRSIEARLLVYPLSSLAALLLYQATNAGLYYIIGMGVYFWAFTEGEVVMGVPWTLPRRGKRIGGRVRV